MFGFGKNTSGGSEPTREQVEEVHNRWGRAVQDRDKAQMAIDVHGRRDRWYSSPQTVTAALAARDQAAAEAADAAAEYRQLRDRQAPAADWRSGLPRSVRRHLG
ncbi:hypothetical protein [Kitasatospora sp. NPDC004272]